ncbi:MAG: fatty-acyl-CoA synthase [Solirubrobacteraceae bacterium]|jgi:fatty-acyl-CoA synthase|nr:fatty-acyl-CoA synthase [Solirubrobacteraceae bacterium]
MLRDTLSTRALTARTLAASGMFAPVRPDRAARALLALRRWGPTPAAGYAASAIRYPDAIALVDDRGSLTFEDVQRRTNALAHAWRDAGVAAGDGVAILCRNHRGLVEATVACSKLGADALFLNTAFAGPELAAVCARERPRVLVYDEEFAAVVAEAADGRERYVAWSERAGGGAGEAGAGGAARAGSAASAAGGVPLLDDLAESGDASDLPVPDRAGRAVILTSGTTGPPKGALRRQPASLAPVAGLLSKIPLRARERTLIAAPMFHSWGLAHFVIAIALSSTLVLRRRFDAEATLSAIDEHGATAFVVVPAMLQRILELGEAAIGRHDLGALRVIAASGSPLPGALATRVMDVFGDVLYNLYGSTEVAWATVATPQDLRAAPATAGRPPLGTVVRLYDDAGDEVVAPGRPGRIFVGSEIVFDGYTNGTRKTVIDGLTSSGDIGHLDAEGRLYVDGREDEMIVSGGENVFPREVEDVVARLEGVRDVAVVGVDDERFGRRLRAFVVRAPGALLTADEVQEHVRANLARFKVPRDVVFVDALPRTATGKVLKRELGSLSTTL